MNGTLAYELNRFYEANRKMKGLRKEDYENLVIFFDSYYGGKSIDKKEQEMLNSDISSLLDDNSTFIFNILQGVKSYPNDKSRLCERLEMFLDYLHKNHQFKYSENIFENFKIKDKNERLLMMLKYLHSGEKSRSDIAEDFGISERTVAEHLAFVR